MRITLINDAGAEVYTQKLGAGTGSHSMDTKSLGAGVYLCVIDVEGAIVHAQKVSVSH